MSTDHSYEHDEIEYGHNEFRGKKRQSTAATNRPVQGRKRAKSPQSVNGIHKRRRRKMSW